MACNSHSEQTHTAKPACASISRLWFSTVFARCAALLCTLLYEIIICHAALAPPFNHRFQLLIYADVRQMAKLDGILSVHCMHSGLCVAVVVVDLRLLSPFLCDVYRTAQWSVVGSWQMNPSPADNKLSSQGFRQRSLNSTVSRPIVCLSEARSAPRESLDCDCISNFHISHLAKPRLSLPLQCRCLNRQSAILSTFILGSSRCQSVDECMSLSVTLCGGSNRGFQSTSRCCFHFDPELSGGVMHKAHSVWTYDVDTIEKSFSTIG